MFDEIKFNDADEYYVNDECLAEVDEKCIYCDKYMREEATRFEGQRDMIVKCECCGYTKSK